MNSQRKQTGVGKHRAAAKLFHVGPKRQRDSEASMDLLFEDLGLSQDSASSLCGLEWAI